MSGRVLLVLAMLLALVPVFGAGALAADRVVASGGRVAGDEERTRFILDLSGEVVIGAFTLGDPWRVIIDLPEVTFNLPTDAGREGRGLVSGWRYGLFASGRSRIVLDTLKPVKIDRAFVLPSVEDQPARLVVDLLIATPAEFAAELQRTAITANSSNEVPLQKSDRLAVGEATDAGLPVVMLDPGHGGVDTGTVSGTGTLEKDVVLSFARKLKTILDASGKVEVKLTRDDDRFIPLRERVKIARDHTSDLFVSIHADSVRQDDVRGATVYTNSEKASDDDAAALAAKENSADSAAGLEHHDGDDEVSDILIDLTRRETRNFSMAFANNLVGELSTATRLIKNPRRSAGFIVLRAHDVPSVLVEIGYLSNEQDEKLLTTEDWQNRVAEATAKSILHFIAQKTRTAAAP